MKKLLMFLFIGIFLISSTLALVIDFDVQTSPIPQIFINYTNVSNSSNYWDSLDTPADINAGDINDDGTYLTSFTETDPYWTANQSFYSTTTTIQGWKYYNLTDFDIND